MSACIGKIRLQGLVKMNKDGTWAEDRDNPLYYLIHVAKVALPLYPQFGTEPNGYYIPPRWVPRPTEADVRPRRRPGDRALQLSRSGIARGAAALPPVEPDHLPLRDQGRTENLRGHAARAEKSPYTTTP